MYRLANFVQLIKKGEELPLDMFKSFVRGTDKPGLAPALPYLKRLVHTSTVPANLFQLADGNSQIIK
jgi:hypothetical protein